MNNKTLKRMLELSNIKPSINENKIDRISNIELIKKGSDGLVYGIVRENKKYFIKQTQKKENITEGDLDYIGGVANKTKYSFNSFSEATRKLNIIFDSLNENNKSGGVDVLTSDEELLSEKKYVLKTKKPKKSEPESSFGGGFGDFETASEEPSEDLNFDDFETPSEEGDSDVEFGTDDMEMDLDTDGGAEETDLEFDDDDEDIDSEDGIKSVQKLTGKLGQKLRDIEDLSSDMQKWVVKSVISALDLENMDSSDKKDIIKSIKAKQEDDLEETYDVTTEEDEKITLNDKILTRKDLYGEEDGEETSRGGERHDKEELLFDVEITEDHYNDEMSTQSQLDTYLELEDSLRDMDMDLEFIGKNDKSGDVCFKVIGANNKNMSCVVIKINGDYEFNKESVVDDYKKNDYLYEKDITMNEPATKPTTKPGTKEPAPAKPSTRPFTPPPHIEPGEEPGPKASKDELDIDFE
jgi:hypothetical protein